MESYEGYRFHPTDSELLTFLMRFIADKDLGDDGYITQHDVYKQEPWITYGYGRHCGGRDTGDTSINRYFITPRSKKRDEGSRFTRTVGEKLGTWKQKDKGKYVTMKSRPGGKSLNVGRKKSLRYETIKGGVYGNWLMKEYVFSQTILAKFKQSARRDYAICAIKQIAPKRNPSRAIMEYYCPQDVAVVADVQVKSEVNPVVEPLMDQEYNAVKSEVNPVVEPLMDQEYNAVKSEVNPVVEPLMDQEYNATAPPRDDYYAYLELEARQLSAGGGVGGTHHVLSNNQVVQEVPVIEDMNSGINMHKIYSTLEEYTGVKVLMHPDYYPNNLFGCSKQAIVVESNEQSQEAAGQENNGLLAITAPFSPIQELANINVPEILYTGDTLLQKNYTQHQPALPQEEPETFCETGKYSTFISDLVEALLGKDRYQR